MLNNLTFRWKLAAVVLPLLVVLTIMTGAVVRPRLDAAGRAANDAARAKLAVRAMELTDNIQLERSLAGLLLGSRGIEGVKETAAQRVVTDKAADELVASVKNAPSDIIDPELRSQLINMVNLVTSSRQSEDRDGANLRDVLGAFDAQTARLLAAITTLITSTKDADLQVLGRAASDYLRGKEYETRKIALVAGLSRDGSGDIEDAVALGSYNLGERDALASFQLNGDKTARAAHEKLLQQDSVRVTDEVNNGFLRSLLARQKPTVDPAAYWTVASQAESLYDGPDDLAFAVFSARATAIRRDTIRSALLLSALAALATLGAVAVALQLGLSLVRRLRAIAEEADDIATNQLPLVLEALRNPSEEIADALPRVSQDANDEIGSMAQSFNTVLRASVETSIEHSRRRTQTIVNMLVNLGRRNQSLLDRQLELIDGLEARHSDPDVLEGLFRLDHLLTRMRRNAENLLILASDQQVRGWALPVPLLDVLRGAASEVSDIERIEIEASPGIAAMVAGHHAVDLSHLVAELVENAASYSPPTARVVLRVDQTRSDYRLWIVDSGVGMAEGDLADANHRISDPPDIDEINTDRVGFQVIGRLARRLGVNVRLQENPRGGVAASVLIPLSLFVDDSDDAYPDDAYPDDAESTAFAAPAQGRGTRSGEPATRTRRTVAPSTAWAGAVKPWAGNDEAIDLRDTREAVADAHQPNAPSRSPGNRPTSKAKIVPRAEVTEDGLAKRTPGRAFGTNAAALAADGGAFRRLPVPGDTGAAVTNGEANSAQRFGALTKFQDAVEESRALQDETDGATP